MALRAATRPHYVELNSQIFNNMGVNQDVDDLWIYIPNKKGAPFEHRVTSTEDVRGLSEYFRMKVNVIVVPKGT